MQPYRNILLFPCSHGIFHLTGQQTNHYVGRSSSSTCRLIRGTKRNFFDLALQLRSVVTAAERNRIVKSVDARNYLPTRNESSTTVTPHQPRTKLISSYININRSDFHEGALDATYRSLSEQFGLLPFQCLASHMRRPSNKKTHVAFYNLTTEPTYP